MKIYGLMVSLLALAFTACTTAVPPVVGGNDPDTTPIIEAQSTEAKVLAETTVSGRAVAVSDAFYAAVVRVDRSSGEIVFDESQLPPGAFGKLEVGNILVGKAGVKARRGFLRKIVSVTRSSGLVVVQTTQGKLNEVFATGGFRYNRKMRISDAPYIVLPNGQKQSLQRSGMTPQGLVFPVQIDFCPINVDGNKNTLNDQVCMSGSVDLELDFDFVFICKGVLCTKPYLDTNVTITQSANLTVTGELAKTINKTVLLGTIPLPIITVPIIGIPLVFVPEIDLEASINGEVSVGFNWSADQEMEFTAGLELEDGKFDTYSTFSKSIKSSKAEVSLGMNVEARVDAEASILVYGIGGPTATLGGFVNFEAGFPRTPTWELEAGLDVSIGLELDLFGLLNKDVKYEIFEKSWTIATAPNTKPSIVIKAPLENETITLVKQTFASGALSGQTYYTIPEIDINTDDLEDGFACCSVAWTIAGLKFTTAIGSGHKFTDHTLIGAAGLKTITATVTDSSGGSTTKTWNFTIKDCANPLFVAGAPAACAMTGVGTQSLFGRL